MEWSEWTGALRSGSLRRMGKRDRSVNSTVVLHDYMVFLYRTLTKLQPTGISVSRGAGFANTVTSFVDQGQDLPSWESSQRYIFDLSSLSRMDELVEAELRILRKPAVDLLTVLTTGGNLYNIRLYSCSPEGASETRLLDSRTVEVLDSGLPKWEVFDVWSSRKARLRNPTEPLPACFHLLALSELTNEVADPLLLGLGRHARLPQHKALLVAFSHTHTNDNLFREITEKMKNEGGGVRLPKPLKPVQKHEKKNRQRRQRALSKRSFGGIGQGATAGGGGGGKTGRRRTRCSRKPLHVNFKDLGWDDWIIAPLDYEAHHCDGVCDFPLRSHLEPTNHAVIQTLMNSMDPDISPPSCCVPSKLSAISILYIDSGNNVVYKQYEDMVVESCGCR
ncbi:growth/differentiation factor 6-A [Toxotes jaculatrix]|uniref:growth/differentiation factor 6-A n=1 Tax=Toxotes jaculatrix TaxID=941984 RepID=UPI001B3A90B6|nr:growth/differentiation factor 6-A [Toxotes jaculatrix]